MMRKISKKENLGITLIALVITIIILLILAGITISQLTGSGLFENAKLAKEKYENSQLKEDDILKQYENAINNEQVASDRNIDIQQLKNQIKQELMQEIATSANTSNDYSIDNQVVGTWIDGKPIYRKYVAKTFDLSATTWTTLEATSVSNVENIVNCVMRRSTIGVYYPLCQIVNNNVSIYYSIPMADTTGYILEYTKVTPTE